MERQIWLSTSLFCERSRWEIVIKNGIVPLVEKLASECCLRAFDITLNYVSGANIRFALLVEDRQKEVTAKLVDDFFKDFFRRYRFQDDIPIHIDGVFLPFPRGSIQYGLYQVPTAQSSSVRRILSEIILHVFGLESIDDEFLLTFAFYLHIGIIKVICQENRHSISEKVFKEFSANFSASTLSNKIANEMYIKSKQIFFEISRDILTPDTFSSPVPNWLLLWMTTIDKDAKRYPGISYFSLAAIIFSQLGFTDNMKFLLCYFTQETIKNIQL